MKRRLAFTNSCFLLITISSVLAQDFNAGLRIGICGSQVSGDRLSGYDKAGIIAGAFVNKSISDHVMLQMELDFIQKGSRKRPSDLDNSFYRMRLHYVEVPLLFMYRPSKKLSLVAGLSFGTLIHSEEEDESGVFIHSAPFNKTEISYQAGIGYQLSENWITEVLYSNSLTPVRDYQGSYNSNFFDRGQYNSLIGISMGYQF